jgi:c-di-GMP-related signal transduction protein
MAEASARSESRPEDQFPDIFIARQPILDANRRVFGYELLYRGGNSSVYDGKDGSAATMHVVLNSLVVFGLNNLVQNASAFINVTRELLESSALECLPRERVVFEILQTVPAEPSVIAACERYRDLGYTLALDGVVGPERVTAFGKLPAFVKLDLISTSSDVRQAILDRALDLGIRVIAEKVETYEEFELTRSMGCHYFQGYFFAKPERLSKRALTPAKLTHLRLIQALNSRDVNFEKMEEIIRQDVALSVRLLRYINSVSFALRVEISSIKHALRLLGQNGVCRWATLLSLAALARDKPAELISTALVRARFCELLAPAAGLGEHSDELFLSGLLSVLDALVDRPLEEALAEMRLAPQVTSALTDGSGRRGSVLCIARDFERGRWLEASEKATRLGIGGSAIGRAYRNSLTWAAKHLAGTTAG